jgi:PAS domain S-box-containing protein
MGEEGVLLFSFKSKKMKDERKTKKEMTKELRELRQRIVELETVKAHNGQAEQALRESEEKYRTLTDNVNAGVYRNTAGSKGKFLEANPAIIRMFGYGNKEEFLALRVADLYQNPDDRKKFNQKMLQEGFVRNEELHLKKKDGTTFIGSVSAVAVKNELGKIEYYDGIIDDITERKKAEAALRESEERYKALFECSLDCVYIHDFEGTFIDANGAALTLLGYEREDIRSLNFKTLLSADQIPLAFQMIQELKKTGLQKVPTEYRVRRKDGEYVDIETQASVIYRTGKPYAVEGIARDITERQRSEKLRNAIYKISEAASSAINLNELFHFIHGIVTELIPTKNFYIALYDSENGILSFPYFRDEFDQPPAPKKLGKGLTEYVLRQGEPLLSSPRKFEELKTRGDVELIGTPAMDWLGVPLKTDDKTIGIMVVQNYAESTRFGEDHKNILMFVSSQVAMAIERKKAEDRLKASLGEKEVLLREVHHRVYNNMQIISSLLNLQASQMKDENALKMSKESQSRIRSMALIHEKLYKSQDFSHINFPDYIRSFATHLFQFNQVNPVLIQLKLDLEDVFLDIQTAIPCGLILNELITNALKYAFPKNSGGEITVELHPAGDHAFQMVVKDDGVGIPEDMDIQHPKSFGLQIVKMLVTQLEGNMEVQRKGGTIFKIVFRELKYNSRF